MCDGMCSTERDKMDKKWPATRLGKVAGKPWRSHATSDAAIHALQTAQKGSCPKLNVSTTW